VAERWRGGDRLDERASNGRCRKTRADLRQLRSRFRFSLATDIAERSKRSAAATDPPAESRAELEDNTIGTQQFPARRIVISVAGTGSHCEHRPIGEPEAQLARRAIHGDISDRATDQPPRIDRTPFCVLRRKTPALTVRVTNFDMEYVRMGNTDTDYWSAHRAQHLRR